MKGPEPDHPGAAFRVSKNFGPRRNAAKPSILLLHYTGMESGQAAEDWLCHADSGVSCHYIVHEDGRIVQLVAESERAWHAGQGCWRGNDDINSASIGIEIVNCGHPSGYPDFPAEQIDAVIKLGRGIVARHSIRPELVLAHSDTAPGRKIDPGEKFPWSTLYAAGIGLYVEPEPVGLDGRRLTPGSSGRAVTSLRSALSRYGYCVDSSGEYDDALARVVAAFQRHFRPALVDGIADPSTRETLRKLVSWLDGLR